MSKIKICGLFRSCDIDYVNEAMPDYIGFVFAKSRRQVTKEQAKDMRKKLKESITPVGVFVNEPIENVIMLLRDDIIQAAQLHGNESEDYIYKLKSLTKKTIIKAVSVKSKEDINNVQNTIADFLLLDNGAGGTGNSFNWNLIDKTSKPFFLAGGINIDNILHAKKGIRPYAIDLSSGVETNGVKDRNKMLEIVRRIRYV
ncbi:phosphoribosylanthranilate isomerase [Anaerovorax odorimutans]|uniref:phosphoribosylanthranilate isomerase n=1 Tax=Anaerovorax odorimutans TaxID=109327 RepID=UPI000422527C|nr:phosphoribosylanthranilate isomerase [Anaerovorax odorimutans]